MYRVNEENILCTGWMTRIYHVQGGGWEYIMYRVDEYIVYRMDEYIMYRMDEYIMYRMDEYIKYRMDE